MIAKAGTHTLGFILGAILSFAPAHAAELVKVKLAEVIRSQFYMPMYVAIAKGYAKDEGLDIELITNNGGDRTGAMVLSGGADFGLAGPEVPIYIYNGESADKPIIFCALTATDGLFIASRQKYDKVDWSAINGKKIMGYRPGSTPELYLEYVLKQNKVDAATIKGITTNVAQTARDGAWISGVGDFGIFNEPNLTKLIQGGHAHYFASVGKEVGRADYTLFFAKKSWLEKHKDIAQKWTNAIARAQVFVQNASEREIAETVAPFFPGLAIDDGVTVVNRYRTAGVPIWATSTILDKAGLAKAQEIMVSGGVLPAGKEVPYEALVDTSYGEAATKTLAGSK
ncbi:ABC transporter substrate-binding protein [Rhodoplanes sp. Z2-YC6860]|uniref:ABC transporter substrate-binding protein n=1 Tax=Rhodoplanes sp. Z2-YC6860 TaxID=674703 RepID=UPI00078E51DD|nr:ABC transporter substrate-binding protein [Rhodoplanes sp. Z2-YC6860]AMN40099.1 ABC transporter substrate-binding protein [Rhodoplanes sp. Z2-YC6860]